MKLALELDLHGPEPVLHKNGNSHHVRAPHAPFGLFVVEVGPEWGDRTTVAGSEILNAMNPLVPHSGGEIIPPPVDVARKGNEAIPHKRKITLAVVLCVAEDMFPSKDLAHMAGGKKAGHPAHNSPLLGLDDESITHDDWTK